ncbi:MAG: helix-turn-helix domain-containing protein [Victivallaceae bacterium]
MKEKNIIPILGRAIQVMEYISAHKDRVTQSELISALNLPQATCYRIIATFVKNNWLTKYGNNQFDISTGLFSVASKALFQLERYKTLQPILEHLAKKVGYSAKLSVRDGYEQVNVLSAKAPWDIAVTTTVGSRCLLTNGGSAGVVLLSAMNEKELALLFKTNKDKTEMTLQFLHESIASFKKQGYYFNPASTDPLAQWHVDALSVAVPGPDKKPSAALTLLSLPGELANADWKKLATEMAKTGEFCSNLLTT